MSKIVCDVCGTSYSDTSAQCPICGYVSPAAALQGSNEGMEGAEYAATKGGHFSKANVKKRMKTRPMEDVDEYGTDEQYEEEEKSVSVPLVITVVVLLLAILGVVGFLTWKVMQENKNTPVQQVTVPVVTTEDVTEDTTGPVVIPCSKIVVSELDIAIPEGGTYEISAAKEPADTTDIITFESMDPEIALVDENGKITPVKTGTTTVVITCGEQVVELTVSCQVPEPFMLDRMEIKMTHAGESYVLYSGTVSMEEITFYSDDEAVATISDSSVVTAVAEGETMVYAQYGEQTVSCKIICEFEEETGEDPEGGVSEDGTETETNPGELLTAPPKATGKKGYVIKTNFGDTYWDKDNKALFDTGHYIGYDITLRLVDGSGNRVEATWVVYNTSIAKVKSAGTAAEITCLAEGTAYAVATTADGETYVCILRVEPYPG